MPTPSPNLLLLQRGIRRGLLTFRREREWGVSLGSLLGIFILVQLLMVLLLGVEGVQALLRSRTDLRLEVQPSATTQDVRNFLAEAGQLSYLENIVYITKEQAYETATERDPQLIAFIERFGLSNPFPDTVGVTLASLDDYEKFSHFLEADRWHTVVDPTFLSQVTDQEAHVFELLNLTRSARSLVLLVLALTAATLIFITTEMIRRRALRRRDEVLVQHLAGAGSASILFPFATEATVLLWLSILASSALLTVTLLSLPIVVPALSTQGSLAPLVVETKPLLVSLLPLFFVGQLLIAPAIALLGAWLGIRPELHAKTLALSLS